MLTVTEAAQIKISEVLAEENNPKMRLRMFVQGGGCSGMSYGFSLDDTMNEDDFEIPFSTTSVLVDSSLQSLAKGTPGR